ncbi:helix-turn-helix domain-containing protein [Rhodococcus qingshengii]|uniref:helix-turn-helix domain-containing protein n=1 Tax=Rhodococcus qingshengii TaxID=334542 RepID=UPI001C8B680B|nr:helix-turn-helix domain-containing protein [Rhodococcus qingshengii]MBX9150087.1 hypothetical protein [Rhodococcus qingshengii]
MAISEQRRERMAQALKLRADNWTYQRIADELGVSRTQAFEDIDEALKEITSEPAALTLKFELDRLDEMQRPLNEVIRAVDVIREFEAETLRVASLEMAEPDHKKDQAQVERDYDRELETTIKRTDAALERLFRAVDRSLKIQDRRAKYLGLDNPVISDGEEEDGNALEMLNESIIKAAEAFVNAQAK